MRLLLIEDDKMISESLTTALRQSGYALDAVTDTQSAGLSLASEEYDLVLLDIGLPDGSGLDVLKALRTQRDPIPVLIITARDTLKDIVAGLDLGADDYMIKPFALEELEARIRVLLRRNQGRSSPIITWGNIELNPATHGFSIGGRKIILSAREFAVLHTLMENPESVVSRQQLEEKIYGWNEEIESNTIEYHISQLRKKIGRDYIRNIRGVGYILEKEDMTSIRRHLLLSLLIVLLVLTAVMIGIVYIDTTTEFQELFTDNLRRMAIVLKGQAFSSAVPQTDPADMDTGELEESYVIQLWDNKGALLRSSRPDLALPLQPREGLNQIEQRNQLWEIYTLKADNLGYVQIAQPREIVATIIGESALRALLPFVVLFVTLAIAGWILVGRSLSPLLRLSQTIRAWDADNMQPLKIADAPQEIVPIVNALNAMLSKLEMALSLQRQFTADAAHELRTPLTAIKLQLDNFIRAQTEGNRQEAISRLSEGIDRSIHLTSQLLAASRSMAVKATSDSYHVKLDEIARTVMASFVAMASAKHIEIGLENNAECFIQGDEEGLRALIGNLLDNAIRYTPQHGKVTVRLTHEIGWVILKVTDTGPGITEKERGKVFQRFYRIPGTPSTGSGLGLSIVKSVVDSHNASIAIIDGPSGQGTTVRVFFRAATP